MTKWRCHVNFGSLAVAKYQTFAHVKLPKYVTLLQFWLHKSVLLISLLIFMIFQLKLGGLKMIKVPYFTNKKLVEYFFVRTLNGRRKAYKCFHSIKILFTKSWTGKIVDILQQQVIRSSIDDVVRPHGTDINQLYYYFLRV